MMLMVRRKDALEDQVPEYGLEALVSTIDDKDELMEALRAAGERSSTFKKHI
jgi:hypothetical protein